MQLQVIRREKVESWGLDALITESWLAQLVAFFSSTMQVSVWLAHWGHKSRCCLTCSFPFFDLLSDSCFVAPLTSGLTRFEIFFSRIWKYT